MGFVSTVCPSTLNVSVLAGAAVYEPPESACVPRVTATVNWQSSAVQVAGPLSVRVGLASLQLCISSLEVVVTEVLVPPPPRGSNTSTENTLSFEPPSVFLASSGVQDVAVLLDITSMVLVLLVLPRGSLYQLGYRSMLGLGSTEPIPMWLRITYAGALLTPLGWTQFTGRPPSVSS